MPDFDCKPCRFIDSTHPANYHDHTMAESGLLLGQTMLVQNEPIGVLVNLGLGRAYAMEGETAKAKSAYQEFLALWKDADPDIPILKQAKAEYAKLQ
jgi:eukaryotic-like serine/threonine-protein kinase